jgi:hypothetical protein
MPFKPGRPQPERHEDHAPVDGCASACAAAVQGQEAQDLGEALRYIADDVVQKAIEGSPEARDEIFNRLEGKPVQAIAGPGGEDVFAPLARRPRSSSRPGRE